MLLCWTRLKAQRLWTRKVALRTGQTAALGLALIACSEQDATPPAAPVANAAVSSISLINAEAGLAVPGFESLTDSATIDLSELGTEAMHLQANVSSNQVSKVEMKFDGEIHTDTTAPYTFPGPDAAGWRLESGAHTFSATPYGADGRTGTPLEISFSITASDYQSLLYVVRPGSIDVFDIDNNHERVKTLRLPGSYNRIWGAVAHAESQRLYISYHSRADGRFDAGMLSYDLVKEEVVWRRSYRPWVDSPDITPDGKTIYLPSGEVRVEGDFWFVIDAATGDVTDTIKVHPGAHNTIVGPETQNVYMGSVRYPYLVVADSTTNKVIREIGPFRSGVRPFTVNRAETLAFVNVSNFLGFEVGDIATGERLYTVPVEGFRERDFKGPLDVQSHGIALSPDETEVWIADNGNKHLHIFDVTGLPERAPVYLESIELPGRPNWLAFSRDGCYAYESSGHVIDAETREIVAKTSYSKIRLQIDFLDGVPAEAYSRYGLGYVTN
jgi:DNA-binding beta-propeller fold protein YncE